MSSSAAKKIRGVGNIFSTGARWDRDDNTVDGLPSNQLIASDDDFQDPDIDSQKQDIEPEIPLEDTEINFQPPSIENLSKNGSEDCARYAARVNKYC
uniref:Uncharacterized protein n=1 Tax=Megaselia scalaris TaxID=36166 RepID=T1GAE4_MEGSC